MFLVLRTNFSEHNYDGKISERKKSNMQVSFDCFLVNFIKNVPFLLKEWDGVFFCLEKYDYAKIWEKNI